MANTRIPQLTPAIALSGTEWVELAVPVGDGFESRRIQTSVIGDLGLTPTGVGAGTYGDANNVPQFTVDIDGRLTFAGNIPLFSGGTVTSVAVATANGFTGSVLNPTSNPVISITTTLGVGEVPVVGLGGAISAAPITGAGNIVLSTSPTLVNPNLGTPSALVLTNATGLPLATGVTGVLPLANGGTGVALVAPGADRILFYDQSAGVVDWLTVGANLSITGTTLNATGGGGGSSLDVGTSVILNGTSTRVLFDNAGVLGEYAISGTGSVAMTASPTFTTPALGTPSAAVLTNATGLPIATGVSGLGTGVATALAVNVGTAGAIVVNGGALGTPSSGTLTNATGLPISTGVSGLGAGIAAFLATPSSANLATAVTDETGSGALVFATSPTLVTPALGTPSAIVLTNATGLPISGLTGLGTGVATALAVNVGSAGAIVVNGGALGTPSSGTLTNATGLPVATGISGLGTNVATALAVNVGAVGAFVVNGGALGTPTSGTLTNATGLPVSTGISGLGTGVAAWLATPSSANLRTAVTDETGTGALVFADTPTLVTPNIGSATGTSLTLGGAAVPTISSTDTLTNKRVTPRVTSISSNATPTVNTDNCDAVDITALATAITSMSTNLSGTPTNFQKLLFRIKDNGTARAITWGASFVANGVALPTTTVISKLLTVGFIWNGATWGCVASAQEA